MTLPLPFPADPEPEPEPPGEPVAWQAKVNRHVQYVAVIGGRVSLRPAVITGFASDSNARLRVGRHGETYGDATTGIARRAKDVTNGAGVYIPA